ncbi:hypothetical protein ACWEGE_45825 [Amycolatopsis sp. NPDC004747]
MTVWWGLAGLVGLLGLCALLRSHRADGTAVDDDPLARYPAAREPAAPNADAAHTPLMTPAITPEMLARPALPRREEAVPESGRMAGEIPAPRPQSGGTGERPQSGGAGVRPEEVPTAPWGEVRPEVPGAPRSSAQVSAGAVPSEPQGAAGRGASGAPHSSERDAAGVASPVPQQAAGPVAAAPMVQPVAEPAAVSPVPQGAAARGGAAPQAVQPVAESAAGSAAAPAPPGEVRAPQPRAAELPSPPKHALRSEEPAPATRPAKETSPPPERTSGGLVGKLKRFLGGS